LGHKKKEAAMANGTKYGHFATLVLRLMFGLMFLTAGLSKFGNLEGFRQYILGEFGNTILAGPMLEVFARALPFVEFGLGVLLTLGLLTRPALVVAGLTLLALFFGKWIVQDFATSAQNALYLLIAVYTLRHADENHYSLDALLFRRK
jgi:thiosulfate dehydrogenase [quinone] large subunit